MLVEHWTDSDDFALESIDTAGQGAGLFVYPCSVDDAEEADRATMWPHRMRVLIDVPADVLVEVQRFAAGEAGNARELVELFVAAERFDDCELV